MRPLQKKRKPQSTSRKRKECEFKTVDIQIFVHFMKPLCVLCGKPRMLFGADSSKLLLQKYANFSVIR